MCFDNWSDHYSLPEVPFTSVNHIAGEGKVGDGVCQNALRNAFRLVHYHAINGAGYHTCHKKVVFQAEQNGRDEERTPGEATDGNGLEFGVHQIA